MCNIYIYNHLIIKKNFSKRIIITDFMLISLTYTVEIIY
jgi:hypothetical protein